MYKKRLWFVICFSSANTEVTKKRKNKTMRKMIFHIHDRTKKIIIIKQKNNSDPSGSRRWSMKQFRLCHRNAGQREGLEHKTMHIHINADCVMCWDTTVEWNGMLERLHVYDIEALLASTIYIYIFIYFKFIFPFLFQRMLLKFFLTFLFHFLIK